MAASVLRAAAVRVTACSTAASARTACSAVTATVARSAVAVRWASSAPTPAAASASAAAAPPSIAGLKKRPRLIDPFRLREAGKWIDIVPYIASLSITYDPIRSGVTGCQELWRQARSKKVRAAFPKYTVDMEEREDGAPAVVKVSFVNGKSVSIGAQDKTLLDLFDVMLEHTAELEEADEIQEMEKN